MTDGPSPAFFLDRADEELASARILAASFPRNAACLVVMAAEMAALSVLAAEGLHPVLPPDLLSLSGMLPQDHPGRARIAAWDPAFARLEGWRLPDPERPEPVPGAAELEEMAACLDGWLGEIRASAGPTPPA